jgi:hypothetical protein
MEIVIVLMLAWYSPIEAVDIDGPGHWGDVGFSIDGDIDTYAYESSWPPYFHPLDLLFSPHLEADRFRIRAANYYEPLLSNPEIEVFLYYNEDCILHFAGTITMNEWVEYPFGGGQFVSSAKVISKTTEYTLRVYEFQLHQVPEPSTILLLISGSLLLCKTAAFQIIPAKASAIKNHFTYPFIVFFFISLSSIKVAALLSALSGQ